MTRVRRNETCGVMTRTTPEDGGTSRHSRTSTSPQKWDVRAHPVLPRSTSRINKLGKTTMNTVFRNRKNDVKEKTEECKGLGGERGQRATVVCHDALSGIQVSGTVCMFKSDRKTLILMKSL